MHVQVGGWLGRWVGGKVGKWEGGLAGGWAGRGEQVGVCANGGRIPELGISKKDEWGAYMDKR